MEKTKNQAMKDEINSFRILFDFNVCVCVLLFVKIAFINAYYLFIIMFYLFILDE